MEFYWWIYPLFIAVAYLYAAVGHGGASGYLALMALAGFAPPEMRSTALLLNIFVSAIAFLQYYRSGNFLLRVFIPLALASVPMAFIGGWLQLEEGWYRKLLGVLLALAALRFTGIFGKPTEETKPHQAVYALLLGGGIGFVSGLTGIGGGVLLSPVLLLLGWTTMKQTAALSAAFILINSVSGFAGASMNGIVLSAQSGYLLVLAMAGGVLGAYAGAMKFNPLRLSRILALVLVIASIKLIFT